MSTFAETLKTIGEIGYVEEVVRSIYHISGLPTVMANELLLFETGELGQVFSVSENIIEALVFSKNAIKVGTKVTRTNKFLEIPVGKELLGCTLDPLGNMLDTTLRLPQFSKTRPIDATPSGIDARAKIAKSFDTGVSLVDLIIPLGKGQRELIIGDRKTGKTNFLMQTLLTQARAGTICVYAAIGKKTLDIKKIAEFFVTNKIEHTCMLVASTSQDPASTVFLTPYTAMAMAENFRDEGHDVFLILDDLTTHAKYYREISLLGKRFPGRNSYPADIFYTHAKLMERGGNFIHEKGSSSITVLPVVETAQGDLSGYIQTNIMSMTDGHLYFDAELFAKGRRPAINPFLSVTRVGRQTQTKLRREMTRELVSFLTLYDKMQSFVHFGADLNESIKNTLATGERIVSFFDQLTYTIIDLNLQIYLFNLIWIDNWHHTPLDVMKQDIQAIVKAYETNAHLKDAINKLISSADTFNGFLNEVRKTQAQILGLGNIQLHNEQPKPVVPPQPAAGGTQTQQTQAQQAQGK